MKLKLFITAMLITSTIVLINACGSGSKSDNNTPQPPNNNLPGEKSSTTSPTPSLNDLLTASRSSDKTTRLEAIKGLEAALMAASQDQLVLIGSRLQEMAQQDADQDVRKEAMRVLSSEGTQKGQDTTPSGNDDGGKKSGNQPPPTNKISEAAGYARCLKKVEQASDASNVLISTPVCSPLMKGAVLKDIQNKLSQWTQANCPSVILIENVRFPYENYRARADSPWLHYGNNVSEISSELASGTKCAAKKAQSVTFGNLEEIK